MPSSAVPYHIDLLMNLSDTQLLARWTEQRDAEAFARIVARHSAMVYSTACRILQRTDLAEDVSQDCFLALSHAKVGVSSLGGWLHTLATRKSLDRLESDTRRKRREQCVSRESESAPQSWDSVKDLVDEAIDELSVPIREVVIAHFLAGKTHQAIAELTGVPRTTVSSRCQKGIAMVREALRRRGVTLSQVGLAGLLTSHAVQAAPVSLTAALGKMALAGAGSTVTPLASTASIGGLLATSKMTVATLVATAICLAGWYASHYYDPIDLDKPIPVGSARAVEAGRQGLPLESEARLPTVGEDSVGTSEVLAKALRNEVAADGAIVSGRLIRGGVPLTDVPIRWCDQSGSHTLARAVTDSSGRFTIRGVGAQFYSLIPEGDKIPRGFVHSGSIKTSRDYDLGDIRVPASASLRGRIVDSDGRPIVNARVFHGFGSNSLNARFNRSILHDAPGADPSVLTKSDGCFEFDNLMLGDHYVLVDCEGHSELRTRIELAAEQSGDTGDLVLSAGLVVHGRVTTVDGSPVANALVCPVGLRNFQDVARRRGVRTDASGSFLLGGLSKVSQILIECKGYDDVLELINWNALPLVLIAKPTFTIRGHVTGASGMPTKIRVGMDLIGTIGRSMKSYRVLQAECEIADDGAFVIDDVPAGAYTVQAIATGLGSSEILRVTVSEHRQPVELTIVRSPRITIRVTDDTGQPVAGAKVVDDPGIRKFVLLYQNDRAELVNIVSRQLHRPNANIVETDAAGLAEIDVDTQFPVALGGFCDGYQGAAVQFGAGLCPSEIELVLTRSSRICGVVSDASGRDRFSMSVQLAKGEGEFHAVVGGEIDAQGRFELGGLDAGSYRIVVHRNNMTWAEEHKRPIHTTPLLGSGVDAREVVRIELGVGESREIRLDIQPLGSIDGRVLQGGQPVANVVVFACSTEESEGGPLDNSLGFDHALSPFTRTDTAGRFRFLTLNTGGWLLCTLHDDQYVIAPKTLVSVLTQGERIERDLVLPGARITGTLDVLTHTNQNAKRAQISAYLFPSEKAQDDVFYTMHRTLPITVTRRHIELGADGEFTFGFVPPGEWIVRLTGHSGRQERILWQQLVRTQGVETVELGAIAVSTGADTTVELQLPEWEAPHKLQAFGGNEGYVIWAFRFFGEHRVFERTISVKAGANTWTGLPAGDYECELVWVMSFGMSPAHSSVGVKRRVRIAADGHATPASIDFR